MTRDVVDRLALAAVFCFSVVGDELALIALTVRVHASTHSPMAVALLFCAGLLPLIVLGPFAGQLVDRFETVRLVAVTVVLQALVVGVMPLASSLPALLVLVLVLNIGTAVVSPAILSLVPTVMGESGATRGYAVIEGTRAVGGVLGLAFGGLLVALVGANALLLADAATFFLFGLLFGTSGYRRRALISQERPRVWRDGVRPVLGDRLLRGALLPLAVAVFCTTAVNTLWIFYVNDVAKLGATGYGATCATWSLGIVVAAATVPKVLREWAHPAALGTATVGLGLAMGSCTMLTSLGPLLVLTLLCGTCNGTQNIVVRSLVQARVPEVRRGRAFALMGALLSAGNVGGMVAGGVIGQVLGSTETLRVSGATTVVAGAVMLVATSHATAGRQTASVPIPERIGNAHG